MEYKFLFNFYTSIVNLLALYKLTERYILNKNHVNKHFVILSNFGQLFRE